MSTAKRATRTRSREKSVTPEQLRAHAKERFENATKFKWTETLAGTFASWVGIVGPYDDHNRDADEIEKLQSSLAKVITYAEGQELRRSDDYWFVSWVLETLKPLRDDAELEFSFWSKKRRTTRDVRLVRFLYNWNFLNLRRRPTVEELTAISILLGHDVQLKPSDSVTSYFNRHQKRMRGVLKKHPKPSLAQVRAIQAANPSVKPIAWPDTEQIGE